MDTAEKLSKIKGEYLDVIIQIKTSKKRLDNLYILESQLEGKMIVLEEQLEEEKKEDGKRDKKSKSSGESRGTNTS